MGMPEPSTSSRIIRFGLFEADLAAGELRKRGLSVRLQERPFEVLAILLERPGEVVTREQFRQRLWSADTFVDFDHSLNTSITKLRVALDDQADNPRFIATIGRRGYRFIAPVEGARAVTDPANKQANPLSLAGASGAVGATAAAAPGLSPSALELPREQPATRRVWAYVAGLTALLLALGLTAYRFLVIPRHKVGSLSNAPKNNAANTNVGSSGQVSHLRRSVAVLAFRNLSKRPDEAWLSTALPEMLSTELAAGEQLRMVPTEDVTRAQMELPVGDADSLSAETLAKLRSELGSDVVVIGSYTVIGEKAQQRIRVDLRIQDAVAGETIAEVATMGTEGDLFELVSQAGAHLREQLGVGARSKDEAATVRASLPSNPEAARFYAEGLARLRNFDPLLARNLLHEAVAAEPNYPLSHAALAMAWSALGYDNKARQEAQQAFNLSTKLSREEQLVVEGSYREANKDWAGAVESYRTLFALFPDNLDYGVRLIQAQVSAANARDAQATLDALHKLPAPAVDDPRIDLAEVGIAWLLADAKRVLATASRAVTKGEAQGARLVVAAAKRAQGAAFRRLGENAHALASYAEARQIFVAAGDRAGAAGVLRDIADTTAEQGNYSSALELYRQSLAVAHEIGSKGGEAADLNNMGVVFENQRNFVAAQKMYELALAKYRQVDNKSQATIALGNVGEVLFYQGNLAGAESRFRQAIDSAHEIGDSDNEAYQFGNMGILLQTRGDLAEAKTSFERALSLWGESDPHDSSAIRAQLGELQLIQSDLAGARKSQEEALAMRQKLGERGSIAESRLALARLSLEEGRPADAEAGAHEAAAEFQAEKVPDLESLAYALVARSQMEQGESKMEDAAKAVDRAVSLSAKSQQPMIRLLVTIIAERVKVVGGASAADRKKSSIAARRKLQAVLAEAEKLGFFGLKLEAQLALGEMEMKFGPVAAGRSRLAVLEKIAEAKGYRLVARKAATAGLRSAASSPRREHSGMAALSLASGVTNQIQEDDAVRSFWNERSTKGAKRKGFGTNRAHQKEARGSQNLPSPDHPFDTNKLSAGAPNEVNLRRVSFRPPPQSLPH